MFFNDGHEPDSEEFCEGGERKLDFVKTPDGRTLPLAVGDRFFTAERLKANGITHVLTVNDVTAYHVKGWPNQVETTVEGRKVTFLENGFLDDGHNPGDPYWHRTMDLGREVLADPSNRLYVHCNVGCRRGPANTYAILRASGYGQNDALAMVLKARHEAKESEYIGYVEQALKTYQSVTCG